MLQIPSQKHDEEDNQDQPDNTTAASESAISTAVADTSPNDSENQNYDENQYERTHSGVLLRNMSAKSRL